MWRDHPRMGGEKSASSWRWISSRGSPPHGRGKACRSCCGHTAAGITPAWAGKRATPTKNGCSGGITPAWAGKRRPPPSGLMACTDHPRMGGEKCYDVVTRLGGVGSPPHGRGKAAVERVWKQWLGITPAWAGKRRGMPSRAGRGQDHPRMGGEKAAYLRAVCGPRGSPPHGRGKDPGTTS